MSHALISQSKPQRVKQPPTPVQPSVETDTTKSNSPVKVKNADNFIAEIADSIERQYFKGDVRMFHDSIFMFADTALIVDNLMTAVGNVTIIQEDTINIFADSLSYDADNKYAELFDDVVMDSDGKQLFTDYLEYYVDDKLAYLRDTTILKKETMTLSSLRGIYDAESKRAYFAEDVVIIDEDLRLTSDSLEYDTDIDRAYFVSPTYIYQDSKQIYTEDGYYDLESGRAFFNANAIIKDGDSQATADVIEFNDEKELLILTGQAEVIDSSSVVKGDLIMFNDSTKDVEIVGNGSYKEESFEIIGPYILYNEDTENVLCEGRSTLTDDKGELTADTIRYDQLEDLGTALDNVVWKDTADNRLLFTERLMYRDSSDYVKATTDSIRPLIIQEVDDDSLYVSADTLISAKLTDTTSYLTAINNVRIYKEDLQAVCDSLYYSDLDSTFVLIGDPVCWSDTTQFTGDTISIVMQNDKVSHIIASDNAFIISHLGEDYYDQIKGKWIHTYLKNDSIERMEVKGNAESLYMVKDEEDAIVGPNKTLCSHMTFYFENNDLDSIKFFTQPESTLVPMKRASDSDLKLENFVWVDTGRPLDVISTRFGDNTSIVKVNSTGGNTTDSARYNDKYGGSQKKPRQQMDTFEQEVDKVLNNTGSTLPSKDDIIDGVEIEFEEVMQIKKTENKSKQKERNDN